MRLLLDTQILVWMITGDARMAIRWQDAMFAGGAELYVSAAVACEYTDLLLRKRLPVDEGIAELIDRFAMTIEDLPAAAWTILPTLPPVHRDPVDRMLVAHAIIGGSAIITADANIRRYPVQCL